MSARGQAFYQDNPNLVYGSLRKDAPPMRTGERLRDFKLLSPADYADYMASRDLFTKEWNATWFKRIFNCLALSGLPEF